MDAAKRAALLLTAASVSTLALVYAVVDGAPIVRTQVGGISFSAPADPSRTGVLAFGFLSMGFAWSAGLLLEGRRSRLPMVAGALAILLFPALGAYHFAGGAFLGNLSPPLSLGASGIAALTGVLALWVLRRD